MLPGMCAYVLSDFIRSILMSSGVYHTYSVLILLTLIFGTVISISLQGQGLAGAILLINLTFGFLLVLSLLALKKYCPWLRYLTWPAFSSLGNGQFVEYSKSVLWISSSQLLD